MIKCVFTFYSNSSWISLLSFFSMLSSRTRYPLTIAGGEQKEVSYLQKGITVGIEVKNGYLCLALVLFPQTRPMKVTCKKETLISLDVYKEVCEWHLAFSAWLCQMHRCTTITNCNARRIRSMAVYSCVCKCKNIKMQTIHKLFPLQTSTHNPLRLHRKGFSGVWWLLDEYLQY